MPQNKIDWFQCILNVSYFAIAVIFFDGFQDFVDLLQTWRCKVRDPEFLQLDI